MGENQGIGKYFQEKFNDQKNTENRWKRRMAWLSLVLGSAIVIWQIGYLIFRYGFDFTYTNNVLPFQLNAIALIFFIVSVFFFTSKRKTIILFIVPLILLFGVNAGAGVMVNSDEISSKKTTEPNRESKKVESPKKDETPTPIPSEAEETPGTEEQPNQTQTPTPTPQAETPAPPVEVSITIPEGFTFKQIADRLEANGVVSKADFYSVAQSYKVQSFTIPSSSNRAFNLEGYLFPDTYKFYKNDDPTRVIKAMLNNYARKTGTPSDETIILASIIEKEARSTDNMKLVAGVLKNRLSKGMKLEVDSTREYVNKNITGNALLTDTGKFAELYNTYKKSGLPAGPISNPSARAIQAALNPTPSEYLYFFFGQDDQNHYSKTLEEHNAQMQQFGVKYAN